MRFLAKFYIVIMGDILNPLWWSREKRRERRYVVITKTLTKYLKKYLSVVKNIPYTKATDNPDEKIYSIWQQGEDNAPKIVRTCWDSMRKHCSQELVILDEKTLLKHIKLPDFIMKKRALGKIGHAHFTDIARVELLYKYGGIWMDSTLFITQPVPDNILSSDFFMFTAKQVLDWSYAGFQNFFIRAKKNSYLLNAWRAMIFEYWRDESGGRIDYLVHQLLFKVLVENDPRAKKEFEKMPKIDLAPTHQLWFLYKNKPFDKKIFDQISKSVFMQKTTYRNPEYVPNSFADVITKGK